MGMTSMQATASAESRDCCDSADLKAGNWEWVGLTEESCDLILAALPHNVSCTVNLTHHHRELVQKAKHSWRTVFSNRERLSNQECFPHRCSALLPS